MSELTADACGRNGDIYRRSLDKALVSNAFVDPSGKFVISNDKFGFKSK
jgi:hypothetical protein